MTVTLVAWPETSTMLSSVPKKSAMATSSSRVSGFSPEATRLADTEVPYLVMASWAALLTTGSPELPT